MNTPKWYRSWHKHPYHSHLHWFMVGLAAVGLVTTTQVALNSYSKELAQLSPFYVNSAMALAVNVASDRINIGTEFIPRRTDLPNKLIVPAGQTVELPANATYDYVEVGGTLRVSRTQDTTTKFTTMIILPGGNLDVGTNADPIPANRQVNFIVRDVPIDTIKDPFQWGNGLINFGNQTRVGAVKTAWGEVTGDIASGATTLGLNFDPTGWRVGDELLIPDTRQPTLDTNPRVPVRRETTVTIQGISGRTITLSKPLDFAHSTIRDPNGQIVSLPRVANLTRNIVISSENPSGTPGHTADVGPTATWQVAYNRFVNLGRTRNISLNDAVADSSTPSGFRAGTNQRGRYADHHHHAMGLGSSSVANVYVGRSDGTATGINGATLTLGPKWGLVAHNVSDATFTDNIAIQFPGAGFVMEDGNEVRNTWQHNFAAYNVGNHDMTVNAEFTDTVNTNNPGGSGNGYFFRAAYNNLIANEAWNNPIGFNLFGVVDSLLLFPSRPGIQGDTPMSQVSTVPVNITDNVANSNSVAGHEYWFFPEVQNKNAIGAFNGNWQFLQGTSTLTRPYFVNATLVGSNGTTTCFGGTTAYVETMKIIGGRAVGCGIGVSGGGARTLTIDGATFQNVLDLDLKSMPDLGATITNVSFVPLASFPQQYILFGNSNASCWDGTAALGHMEGIAWESQRGSIWKINNFNGTGKNYQLFNTCQLGSRPAPPSFADNTESVFTTPEAGLTMLQSWNKYGIAMFGEAVDDSKAVVLPGLVNGYAREGSASVLRPPLNVMTSPTLRAPVFTFSDGSPTLQMRLYFLLTGDHSLAPGPALASIDNGPIFISGQSPVEKFWSDDRRLTIPAVAPGAHTIRTWRSDASGTKIDSTLMTSSFFVGSLPSSGQISISPGALMFNGISAGATPAAQSATLSNVGTISMSWSAMTDQNWCHLAQTSGTLAPNATSPLTVTVDAPSNIGTFTCSVSVTSTNAINSPQMLAVNYSVTGGMVSSYQRTINIIALDGRSTRAVTGTLSVLSNTRTLIKSYPITVDASGNGTVTFDITPQAGFLKIKATPFLTRVISVDLNSTMTYSVPKLLIGDINQDNIVNSVDFSAMNAKWFSSDMNTDLNQDGLVNSLDFSLMNKNWFVNGEQ